MLGLAKYRQVYVDWHVLIEVPTCALHAGEGDLKRALASMMQLKGVGAATASAVLAAGMPDVPFMSDELLLVGNIISCRTSCRRCIVILQLKTVQWRNSL